jgi:hypothetical protein
MIEKLPMDQRQAIKDLARSKVTDTSVAVFVDGSLRYELPAQQQQEQQVQQQLQPHEGPVLSEALPVRMLVAVSRRKFLHHIVPEAGAYSRSLLHITVVVHTLTYLCRPCTSLWCSLKVLRASAFSAFSMGCIG